MPTCDSCGAHVTAAFHRTFRDNQGVLRACQECKPKGKSYSVWGHPDYEGESGTMVLGERDDLPDGHQGFSKEPNQKEPHQQRKMQKKAGIEPDEPGGIPIEEILGGGE